MGIWEMNAWQLMLKGGPVMWPILLCSFFAFGLFVEKLLYFKSISTNVEQLKANVFELVRQNKIKEAIILCEQNPSPVASIMKAGIMRFGATREEIKEAMEDVSLYEIPQLERRLSALGTIAHISPLLGLLGTVTGMTGSFHAIQVRSASLNPLTPGDLAGGIWEALLTTVFGLFVAIPALLAYNYCVSRVNHFVVDMERAATEVVNLLSYVSERKVAEPGDVRSEI